MMNVKATIEGNTLVIRVDLIERHGRSSSGKTTIIASTQGNKALPAPFADVQFGLNVYTKG